MKNQSGVTTVIFLFLLSHCSDAVPNVPIDTSGVQYIAIVVNKNSQSDLTNQINDAKSKNEHYYIGIAQKQKTETVLQTMCRRQGGKVNVKADGCSPSTHHKDLDAGRWGGYKLTRVYYAKEFFIKKDVCAIEKKFIDMYMNTYLCVNSASGGECPVDKEEANGIVYLRIYK